MLNYMNINENDYILNVIIFCLKRIEYNVYLCYNIHVNNPTRIINDIIL